MAGDPYCPIHGQTLCVCHITYTPIFNSIWCPVHSQFDCWCGPPTYPHPQSGWQTDDSKMEIQELKKRIEKLEKEIERLKNKI